LRATQRKPVQVGLVTAFFLSLLFFSFFGNVQAQSVTTFTPTDKFSIPELNGSISFALNGSYSTATLENQTWIFNDLVLNGSQNMGTLKISAQNSNITVWDYRPSTILGRSQVIRYTAQGQGVQTVNLNVNITQPTEATEWMVIVEPAVFLSEGKGWTLQSDNTVTVSGQTGNVTVFHYKLNVPDDSNLPFYQRHSVALMTITVVAVVVVAAVLITAKARR
jgi:hypothetical protein